MLEDVGMSKRFYDLPWFTCDDAKAFARADLLTAQTPLGANWIRLVLVLAKLLSAW